MTFPLKQTEPAAPGPVQRKVAPHHFDASRVLTRIVTFVSETLVPLMVVAPKNHVLLPSETATALLPGAGVVEPLDGSLLQPTIKTVAEMTATIIAFFMKRDGAQRSALVTPNPKLKLLDQVREVMRLKHYSIRTERTYCDWIRRDISSSTGLARVLDRGFVIVTALVGWGWSQARRKA